jgi:phosphatidate phosphatase APP1
MFGDSGEYDPEVYETILNQEKFRPMVTETSIRDVKGLAANDPRRQKMVCHKIIVSDARQSFTGNRNCDCDSSATFTGDAH